MTTDGKKRPYERVAADIRLRIFTGALRPDQKLPGRTALAGEYGVALATVSRAVSRLEAEGLLQINDRCGTFVAPPAADALHAKRSAPPTFAPRPATVAILAALAPGGAGAFDASLWAYRIVQAIEDGLGQTPGVVCRFVSTLPVGTNRALPADALRTALADDVDAVAVLTDADTSESLLPRIESAGKPAVRVGYDPLTTVLPQVYVDSQAGGALAARHLLAQGWSHPVFLMPFAAVWAGARRDGARVAAARLPSGESALRVWPPAAKVSLLLTPYEGQIACSARAAVALLARPLAPNTGIVAANDAVALGFMQTARARGLEAGRDYGIVGFDDYLREEGLSSLRPPLEQLGRETARAVEALLRGETPPVRVALRHRLVARDSSRKRALALAGAARRGDAA